MILCSAKEQFGYNQTMLIKESLKIFLKKFLYTEAILNARIRIYCKCRINVLIKKPCMCSLYHIVPVISCPTNWRELKILTI